MKFARVLIAASLLLPSINSFAAYQSYPVRNRLIYIDGYGRTPHVEVVQSAFRVEVLSDSDGVKSEEERGGRPHVTVSPGEKYSVRIYNPLPVRVGVNLTVDGINSISGKPSGISDGEKWIIDPYGVVTIRGWQVNNGEERRFFFTEKKKSYAKWRGLHLQKDLAANCGVIGVAFFWSQDELDQYYEQRPIDKSPCFNRAAATSGPRRAALPSLAEGEYLAAPAPADDMDARPASQAKARPHAVLQETKKAGTGMGEREDNPVVSVDFHYDTGMYDIAKAIVIYYDFAQPVPMPNPFPDTNYAPEM